MTQPSVTLREAAKRFGGRVSTCLVYDANVCSTTFPPGRLWERVCVSGSPFTRFFYGVYRNRRIRMSANDVYILIEVKGPYRLGVLMLNFPNRVSPPAVPAQAVAAGGRQYRAFTRDGQMSQAQLEALRTGKLSRLLEVAEPGDGESLHLYDDVVEAYLKLPTLDRICGVVEAMIDLVPEGNVESSQLELQVLPPEFHPLIPLIRKWAISDDQEREEVLSGSPKRPLKELVRTVEPYLAAIDAYLDSLGENPPLEACALGTLAECALEAKALLDEL